MHVYGGIYFLHGDCSSSTEFCELIFELDLFQVLTTATHKQGNILDLVLTNLEINRNITDVIVHSDPILFPSDHFTITFKLTTAKQPAHKSGSFFALSLPRETIRDFVNL